MRGEKMEKRKGKVYFKPEEDTEKLIKTMILYAEETNLRVTTLLTAYDSAFQLVIEPGMTWEEVKELMRVKILPEVKKKGLYWHSRFLRTRAFFDLNLPNEQLELLPCCEIPPSYANDLGRYLQILMKSGVNLDEEVNVHYVEEIISGILSSRRKDVSPDEVELSGKFLLKYWKYSTIWEKVLRIFGEKIMALLGIV